MKCPHCKGCYETVWLYSKVYKYCSLCREIYTIEPGGILVLITEQEIINEILKLKGNVI